MFFFHISYHQNVRFTRHRHTNANFCILEWYKYCLHSIFILFFIFLAIGFIINDYSIFVILYFLYVIFILIIAIPNFSLCIRRLHDVGKSGWFYLIGFIPIINLWPAALILFVDSEPHTNQWGEDPKKDERIKIH